MIPATVEAVRRNISPGPVRDTRSFPRRRRRRLRSHGRRHGQGAGREQQHSIFDLYAQIQ